MDSIYYNISFFFLQETILLLFVKPSYKNKTRKKNGILAQQILRLDIGSIPSKSLCIFCCARDTRDTRDRRRDTCSFLLRDTNKAFIFLSSLQKPTKVGIFSKHLSLLVSLVLLHKTLVFGKEKRSMRSFYFFKNQSIGYIVSFYMLFVALILYFNILG